jgi:hypothetical protein
LGYHGEIMNRESRESGEIMGRAFERVLGSVFGISRVERAERAGRLGRAFERVFERVFGREQIRESREIMNRESRESRE